MSSYRPPHSLRAFAWLVDFLIVALLVMFALPQPMRFIVPLALLVSYHTILVWLFHRTPGKASSRLAESNEATEKAMRLDPLNPDFYLANVGFAYIIQGRYAEAIPILKNVIARYPNHISVYTSLAMAYIEVGEEAAARQEAAEVLRINPRWSREIAWQRAKFGDPAWRARARADLTKAGLK